MRIYRVTVRGRVGYNDVPQRALFSTKYVGLLFTAISPRMVANAAGVLTLLRLSSRKTKIRGEAKLTHNIERQPVWATSTAVFQLKQKN